MKYSWGSIFKHSAEKISPSSGRDTSPADISIYHNFDRLYGRFTVCMTPFCCQISPELWVESMFTPLTLWEHPIWLLCICLKMTHRHGDLSCHLSYDYARVWLNIGPVFELWTYFEHSISLNSIYLTQGNEFYGYSWYTWLYVVWLNGHST